MSQDAGWDLVSCLLHSQRDVGQPALPWGQQARALEGSAGKGPKSQVLAVKDQGQLDGAGHTGSRFLWNTCRFLGGGGLSAAVVKVMGPHLQPQMFYVGPG